MYMNDIVLDYEALVNKAYGYDKVRITTFDPKYGIKTTISYYVKILTNSTSINYVDLSLPDTEANTVIAFCIGLLYQLENMSYDFTVTC